MAAIAISLLWLLIYAICLAAVIAVLLYGFKTFIYAGIPPIVEQGIWFIFGVLVLIYAITVLAGGGGVVPHPFLGSTH